MEIRRRDANLRTVAYTYPGYKLIGKIRIYDISYCVISGVIRFRYSEDTDDCCILETDSRLDPPPTPLYSSVWQLFNSLYKIEQLQEVLNGN